jgi:hypothetical protein
LRRRQYKFVGLSIVIQSAGNPLTAIVTWSFSCALLITAVWTITFPSGATLTWLSLITNIKGFLSLLGKALESISSTTPGSVIFKNTMPQT